MPDQDPMRSCSCPHPAIGHHKESGACYAPGCMCGWEVRDGIRYMAHPKFDERIMPFIRAAGLKHQAHVIPEPSFPIRQQIPAEAQHLSPPVRKEHERKFPGQPCYYCGGKAESVDHLLPRSKGGKNDLANLVPACMRCNQMKSDMTLEEFLAHLEKVVQTIRQKPGKVIQAGGRDRLHLWQLKAA